MLTAIVGTGIRMVGTKIIIDQVTKAARSAAGAPQKPSATPNLSQVVQGAKLLGKVPQAARTPLVNAAINSQAKRLARNGVHVPTGMVMAAQSAAANLARKL